MRALGKFLLGTLAVIGFLFLGLIGLAWWGISSLDFEEMMAGGAERPDQMVLTVDLRREFPEGEPEGPFALLPDGAPLSLSATVRAIDAAAADPDVRGLLAEIGGTQAGMAQAQALRAAVARFRASGKPAIIFAETLNEGNDSLDTYIATAFDEVWLQPSGGVGPLGFATEVPFLRNLLEEVGVRPQFDAREDHKSAFDSLTRDSMDQFQREDLQDLLGGFWSQFVTDVAADRNLSPETVRQVAQQSPLLAPEALDSGLVDRLAYRDEVEAEVFTRAGTQETLPLEAYAGVELEEAPEAAPRVALIQASGPIMRGEAEKGPLGGGAGIYSDTLSRAIEAAVEDGGVRAIVLRIDSPGGSYVASDTVWRTIRRARDRGMPVVVSMGNTAASGGYFIAMAGDHIVAEPGTVTGSIGVVSGKFVLSDLWRKLEVNWDDVSVGGPRLMYSPNQDFTQAQWAEFQKNLDWIYNDFVSKVAEARGMTKQQVRGLAGGRIWTGAAAAEKGLVDSLGGLDEAVAEAKRRAGIATDTAVALEPFPKPATGLDRLLEALESTPLAGSEAEALAALARVAAMLEPLTRRIEAMEQGPLRAPVVE
ncbi:Protease IV [Caenispirillum salinarum AK4]|uniref:Protease IV n=1 Tax=Caenispirillum salinarum AK4 TaxID=1238182 RepID=K9HRA8_9PROT|nr:signal peptide peptidase SppA [Caenispirillum salinarum]EKV30946.1 Protease IV [Caenispirillum salinarum AK4]